jgi:vitamin B12/bleomycin/antimicrobial peptide transport system ATP-binding/permease protein
LYRGEASEAVDLNGRFDGIRANWWQLMRYTKYLTFLTAGYSQLAGIFPLLVTAPRYFAGAIDLGVLTQTADAFGRVQGSLSWFVGSYADLASWKATVDRLLLFQDAMLLVASEAASGIEVVADGAAAVRTSGLDLALPDGRWVLKDVSVCIAPGDRLLVTGPNGSGKTTLFRAIAGIWPFGKGLVEVPAHARMLFLPQRPYFPIASLRAAVSYPAASSAFREECVREVLRAVGLPALSERLDEVQNWSLQLSGGEQQRVAIARALLHLPDWLFLDEATAALDECAETVLYGLLRERLPAHAAIVSIAHRSGVAPFHERRLDLGGGRTQAQLLA